MSKHTPGPWLYDLTGFRVNKNRQRENLSFTISTDLSFNRKSIAKIHSLDPMQDQDEFLKYDNETAEANAKLIAAAPELLAALIECLEGVKELNGEYQDGWDSVIENAERVIKKATQ